MRRLRFAAAGIALVVAATGLPSAASAQQQQTSRPQLPQLAPKRARLTAVEQRCQAEPAPRAVTYEQRAAAGRLLSQGDQALLTGDPRAARDAFLRAADADPRAPAVAYRLARTYEELNDSENAARQYCRYVALAPKAPDAGEVLERVERLRPARVAEMRAAEEFLDRGLAHIVAGRADEAAVAFSGAVERAPNWADAYFNRSVAEAARGQPRRAERDLRRYLELNPGAADRQAVLSMIEILRAVPAPRAPGGALARGLLVPGLGQFYTGRPALGALILAGAGVTYAMALREEEVTRTIRRTDPFGNPYDDPYVVRQRPDLGRGIALAATITALGAVEAYLFASRATEPGLSRAEALPPALPRLGAATDGALLVQWRLPAP
jgi:tetratricopeptide (TPR) repeat protein